MLQHAAEGGVFHRAAGADRDAGQRIVGHGDGQAGRVLEQFVEFSDQRTATGQDDALINDCLLYTSRCV